MASARWPLGVAANAFFKASPDEIDSTKIELLSYDRFHCSTGMRHSDEDPAGLDIVRDNGLQGRHFQVTKSSEGTLGFM